MKQSIEIDNVTLQEAEAFYHHNVSTTGPYALVSFTDNFRVILKQEAAINLVQTISDAEPVADRYTATKEFALPTMRILTVYEHRIYWLANYFGVAYSDMEEKTYYDPMREYSQQHRVDYNAPSLYGIRIEEEFNGDQ